GKGVDTFKGGLASDFYFFSAGRFGASDFVDGGTGARNQLQLLGDYTISFGAGQLANIHSIVFLSGRDIRQNTDFDYTIVMDEGNLVSGQMTIDGGQLKATEKLAFDGSQETTGTFKIFGGKGEDSLTGSQNGDILFGAGGRDYLKGGAGADTYSYRGVSDSTSTGYDTIDGFVFGTDMIDLTGTHDSFEVKNGGTLNSASFDADLAAAMGGTLDPSEAVLFTPNAGDLAGKLFLIVDENGTAGYQAGQDYVIEMINTSVPMATVSDFIV
ncbi:MAG TPA: bluetail domain-containing putative surface protein, partial [Allosphingosinicella sp.]